MITEVLSAIFENLAFILRPQKSLEIFRLGKSHGMIQTGVFLLILAEQKMVWMK